MLCGHLLKNKWFKLIVCFPLSRIFFKKTYSNHSKALRGTKSFSLCFSLSQKKGEVAGGDAIRETYFVGRV